MSESAQKLAILAWSVSPAAPDLAAAPLIYACAAAALDCTVELHFAGPAVELLVDGVAQQALTAGGKSLYSYLREAADLGVELCACAMAAKHYLKERELIPEVTRYASASAFVRRTLDSEWRTLVF